MNNATDLSPSQIAHSDRQEQAGYFLQFKDNGECIFLTYSDSSYSCSVYHARPSICRSYPKGKSQLTTCRENLIKLDKITF
ncbi:MAG: YkgJ family cysteine cluster protein [Thalassotalea sp.]